MIYEYVAPHEAIRQGDIFRKIPRVDLSLREMTVLARTDKDPGSVQMDWEDALGDADVVEVGEDGTKPCFIRALVPLAAVDAIVITQDCDA